jgi:predicted RNA polymerase sigma factor
MEDLLRTLAPQVLGALVRRYGNLDTAEDATQEALLAAASSGQPTASRGTHAAGSPRSLRAA